MINLDDRNFETGEVARISGLEDVKLVNNWTDRGLADPYHADWYWKRGRGRARSYTLRDILRFALMRDLSERYAISVSLGRRICGSAFSDAFSPANPGYLIVEKVRADFIAPHWQPNEKAVMDYLRQHPRACCLLINVATIWESVTARLGVSIGEDAQ